MFRLHVWHESGPVPWLADLIVDHPNSAARQRRSFGLTLFRVSLAIVTISLSFFCGATKCSSAEHTYSADLSNAVTEIDLGRHRPSDEIVCNIDLLGLEKSHSKIF